MNKVFDTEHISKPIVYLKGVGRYCQAEGCTKHVFGYANKRFCSNKCRWKSSAHTYSATRRNKIIMFGLHAFINLKTHGDKNQYRIMKIYLKKNLVQEVKITPEAKELWVLLDKIEGFRNKPLEVFV